MAKIYMYKGYRLPTTARACHHLLKQLIDELEVAKQNMAPLPPIMTSVPEPFMRVPRIE